jgi:flagellar motor protein MotB
VRSGVFALLCVCACAATIERTEHEAAIAAQKEDYEAKLLRADEDRRRVEKQRDETSEEAKKTESTLEMRVDQLETALADKQRTLDDVTTQLVELQDAFGKLSSKARSKMEGDTEREKQVKAAVSALRARFVEALKQEEAEQKVAIEAKDNGIVVRFKDGVLFARGSSKLQNASKGTIERTAAAIKASEGSPIKIEVHTDAVRSQDTWALTDQQGAALVRALQKLGVDPSRLSYTSFGQYRPLQTNDTDEGRTENRRVELLVDVPLVLPKR